MAKRKRHSEPASSSNTINGHASKPTPEAAKLSSTLHTPSTNAKSSAESRNGSTNGANVKTQGGSKKSVTAAPVKPAKVLKTESHVDVKTELPAIQIVTGSYERTLHGITASMEMKNDGLRATYADSFLFNAHNGAVRCLALSPLPEDASQGVYLATGGSDERVNVFSLSAAPMPEADSKGRKVPTMPTLGPNKISENPMNRELGTLVQHSASVTALHFPTRSKLLSASEDNTISVTRVRDLEVISTVKAPKPKASGQASGDSAAAETIPAGVNDFAIHPSMKLMVSVGRGERSMRLWNLVTGKKAGVLNFSRDLLQTVKEGKYSHGEGRRIQWNKSGTEFAVAFERGIVVFGQDSKAKCVLMPSRLTKVHYMVYFTCGNQEFVAVSTEDGKILFFDTSKLTSSEQLPVINPSAYAGGAKHSIDGRIKAFQILDMTQHGFGGLFVVVGCSDGNISLLTIRNEELLRPLSEDGLVGTACADIYKTGSRITCLAGFIMLPPHDIEGGLSEAESVLGSEAETEDSIDDD